VKIDQSIGDHPKFLAVVPELYLSAVGLQTIAIGWCDRMRTDGSIPKHCIQKMVIGDASEVLTELVRVGLWSDEDDHFEIHDYLEYQDSAETIAVRSENARKGGKARWGRADSTADSSAGSTANSKAPEPSLTEPIRTEGEGARAGALPPCLSTKFEGTRWSATDDSKHETAAQAFWASLEHIKGGIVSTAEHGSFCAIVSDSCPAGCTGTDDEVNDCLTVLTKALEKTKGKPSPLFRKICEEDR
jgi:hypothetical protein